MLTRNCTLLRRFFFVCDLIEQFRSVFSSSLHGLILFVTNVFINTEDYQHGRECVYQQLSSKSWEADSSIGQKSSSEEYAHVAV